MIPTLPSQLKEQLKRLELTICTAESLTAGLLSSTIASVSGSSAYLLGGVCTYTLESKVYLLGVDLAEAKASDCVSGEVAVQMAAGALRLFGADIAISTTGYSEPNPALGIGAPFAYVCVKVKGRPTTTILVEGPGLNRTEMRTLVVETALTRLVRRLGRQIR